MYEYVCKNEELKENASGECFWLNLSQFQWNGSRIMNWKNIQVFTYFTYFEMISLYFLYIIAMHNDLRLNSMIFVQFYNLNI